MGTFVDLSGQVFGRLTVLRRAENYGTSARFVCQCECGITRPIMAKNLRNGVTKSCGCLNNENKTTHGLSRDKTYSTWVDMKLRCLNPSHKAYRHYGGRGITVCERWLVFENFFKDMGVKPDGLSLDRIDNNGDYEPNNCKWSTWKEQRNNQRVSVKEVVINFNGVDYTLSALAKHTGKPKSIIRDRIKKLNWNVDAAVNTPLKERKK